MSARVHVGLQYVTHHTCSARVLAGAAGRPRMESVSRTDGAAIEARSRAACQPPKSLTHMLDVIREASSRQQSI